MLWHNQYFEGSRTNTAVFWNSFPKIHAASAVLLLLEVQFELCQIEHYGGKVLFTILFSE